MDCLLQSRACSSASAACSASNASKTSGTSAFESPHRLCLPHRNFSYRTSTMLSQSVGRRRRGHSRLQVLAAVRKVTEKHVVCSKTLVGKPGKEERVDGSLQEHCYVLQHANGRPQQWYFGVHLQQRQIRRQCVSLLGAIRKQPENGVA